MISVLIPTLACNAVAHAQQEGRTAQLLKMYQECVFDTVKSQVRNNGASINPSAASEVAFQSCRTEEQAISAHASVGGVSQVQANQVITDYKLKIKQQVRKMFAEAEAAAQRAAQSSIPAIADRAPHRPGCRGAYRRYDGEWVYINCN
jgi:hypothetical protein